MPRQRNAPPHVYADVRRAPRVSSWPEDSISAWRSGNITIRDGLVDGNNSPTGVGIMFEGDDREAAEGPPSLVEDVDAIRTPPAHAAQARGS